MSSEQARHRNCSYSSSCGSVRRGGGEAGAHSEGVGSIVSEGMQGIQRLSCDGGHHQLPAVACA